MVLHLVLSAEGVRAVALPSLAQALERVLLLSPEEQARELGLLLAAVENAAEAPLPGLTPSRADEDLQLAGLELAEPLADEQGRLVHPGAV